MRRIINSIRHFFHHTAQSAKTSAEILERMDELIRTVNYLTQVVRQNATIVPELPNHYDNINDGYQGPPTISTNTQRTAINFDEAFKKQPNYFAHKTQNPNAKDYDAEHARNFPNKILNAKTETSNPFYAQLKKYMRKDEIPETQWKQILQDCLAEAKAVPHAEQLFERKAYVEQYLETLKTTYQASYNPGWVNLEDALFLYWVVRQLKPKHIVQTGVCNGLSSAFMMLALAKNGSEGRLHVVDMPPVFDPNNPIWTIKGKMYGVVIPEGKSSGWLVPDAYHDRFTVLNGDAKILLPDLLQSIGNIDMFYHDSDHTYDHMIFEFTEAKKYLTKHGVIVSDDISWNASLWDFADQYLAPAYNYRGSMGIACF